MIKDRNDNELKKGDYIKDIDIGPKSILQIVDISDEYVYVENNYTPLYRTKIEDVSRFFEKVNHIKLP